MAYRKPLPRWWPCSRVCIIIIIAISWGVTDRRVSWRQTAIIIPTSATKRACYHHEPCTKFKMHSVKRHSPPQNHARMSLHRARDCNYVNAYCAILIRKSKLAGFDRGRADFIFSSCIQHERVYEMDPADAKSFHHGIPTQYWTWNVYGDSERLPIIYVLHRSDEADLCFISRYLVTDRFQVVRTTNHKSINMKTANTIIIIVFVKSYHMYGNLENILIDDNTALYNVFTLNMKFNLLNSNY